MPLPPRQFYSYYALARLVAGGVGTLPSADLGRALHFEGHAFRIEADPDDAGRLDDVVRRLRECHHQLFPFDDDGFAGVLKQDLYPKPEGLRGHVSKVNAALRNLLGDALRSYESG